MLKQDKLNSPPSNSVIGKKSDEKITYQSLIEVVKRFQRHWSSVISGKKEKNRDFRENCKNIGLLRDRENNKGFLGFLGSPTCLILLFVSLVERIIDLVTVFDAILTSRQTREKLQ